MTLFDDELGPIPVGITLDAALTSLQRQSANPWVKIEGDNEPKNTLVQIRIYNEDDNEVRYMLSQFKENGHPDDVGFFMWENVSEYSWHVTHYKRFDPLLIAPPKTEE